MPQLERTFAHGKTAGLTQEDKSKLKKAVSTAVQQSRVTVMRVSVTPEQIAKYCNSVAHCGNVALKVLSECKDLSDTAMKLRAEAPKCTYSLRQAMGEMARKPSASTRGIDNDDFLARPPPAKKDRKGKIKKTAAPVTSTSASSTPSPPKSGAVTTELLEVLLSKLVDDKISQQVVKSNSDPVDFDTCVRNAVADASTSADGDLDTRVIAALQRQMSEHVIVVSQKMQNTLRNFYFDEHQKASRTTMHTNDMLAITMKSQEVAANIITIAACGLTDRAHSSASIASSTVVAAAANTARPSSTKQRSCQVTNAAGVNTDRNVTPEVAKTMLAHVAEEFDRNDTIQAWQKCQEVDEIPWKSVDVGKVYKLVDLELNEKGMPFDPNGISLNPRKSRQTTCPTPFEKYAVDLITNVLIVKHPKKLCRSFERALSSSPRDETAAKRSRTFFLKNLLLPEFLKAAYAYTVEEDHKGERLKQIFNAAVNDKHSNVRTCMNEVAFLGADVVTAMARGCIKHVFNGQVIADNNCRMPLDIYMKLAAACKHGLLFHEWKMPSCRYAEFGGMEDLKELGEKYGQHLAMLGLQAWGKLKPGQKVYPYIFLNETRNGSSVEYPSLCCYDGTDVIGMVKLEFRRRVRDPGQSREVTTASEEEIDYCIISDGDDDMENEQGSLPSCSGVDGEAARQSEHEELPHHEQAAAVESSRGLEENKRRMEEAERETAEACRVIAEEMSQEDGRATEVIGRIVEEGSDFALDDGIEAYVVGLLDEDIGDAFQIETSHVAVGTQDGCVDGNNEEEGPAPAAKTVTPTRGASPRLLPSTSNLGQCPSIVTADPTLAAATTTTPVPTASSPLVSPSPSVPCLVTMNIAVPNAATATKSSDETEDEDVANQRSKKHKKKRRKNKQRETDPDSDVEGKGRPRKRPKKSASGAETSASNSSSSSGSSSSSSSSSSNSCSMSSPKKCGSASSDSSDAAVTEGEDGGGKTDSLTAQGQQQTPRHSPVTAQVRSSTAATPASSPVADPEVRTTPTQQQQPSPRVKERRHSSPSSTYPSPRHHRSHSSSSSHRAQYNSDRRRNRRHRNATRSRSTDGRHRRYGRKRNSPYRHHSVDEREGYNFGPTRPNNSPHGEKYRHPEHPESDSMSRIIGRPRVTGYTTAAYSAQLDCFTRKRTHPEKVTSGYRMATSAQGRPDKVAKHDERQRRDGSYHCIVTH